MDGDSDTTFSSGSCSQTGPASNPWWRVDLGREEPVNQVYIVNRGDCCGDLLNSFEIRVGRSQFRLILFNQNLFANLLTFYLNFVKLLKIDFKASRLTEVAPLGYITDSQKLSIQIFHLIYFFKKVNS